MKISKSKFRSILKEEVKKAITETGSRSMMGAEEAFHNAAQQYLEALVDNGFADPRDVRSRFMNELDGFLEGYEMEYDNFDEYDDPDRDEDRPESDMPESQIYESDNPCAEERAAAIKMARLEQGPQKVKKMKDYEDGVHAETASLVDVIEFDDEE